MYLVPSDWELAEEVSFLGLTVLIFKTRYETLFLARSLELNKTARSANSPPFLSAAHKTDSCINLSSLPEESLEAGLLNDHICSLYIHQNVLRPRQWPM